MVLDHDELLGARETLKLFGKAIGVSHCNKSLVVVVVSCSSILKLISFGGVRRGWLCTLDPSSVSHAELHVFTKYDQIGNRKNNTSINVPLASSGKSEQNIKWRIAL